MSDSDYGFLNPKASERTLKNRFDRTNEFLVKIAILQSLPSHEQSNKLQEILREVFIRMLQLENRIAELEEKL